MPLAYPTPAEHLHRLLRDLSEAELIARFTRWGFTNAEGRSLLALRPLAHRHGCAYFAEHVFELVRHSPDDYPPILRPRQPATGLEASREQYRALLKGKRVALVGPSASVVGTRQGEALDAFDLVVRLNFQWPLPPQLVADIGRRMDILYHCCNGDVPITKLFQPGFERTRFVCWQFGIDSDKLQDYCLTTGVPEVEVSSVYEELLQQMRAFPTTGTVALFDLLSHDVECLYVTGMTFFRDRHHDGYLTGGGEAGRKYQLGQSKSVGIHNVAAQFDLVRRIQASDPRLSVDAQLGELLAGSRAPCGPLDDMGSGNRHA